MNKLISTVSTIVIGIALSGFSVEALAKNTTAHNGFQTRAITVSYSDLDLSHTAGIQTLYSRLQNAAIRACGHEGSLRDLRKRRSWKQCVATALDNAVEDVAEPGLRKFHIASTNGRSAYIHGSLTSSE